MRSELFALPLFALTASTMALPTHARAAENTAEATVAGAATVAMIDSWTIVQNDTKSPEHITLAQAITAAAPADAAAEPPAAEPTN